jgi:hypothetical protein
MSDTHSLLEPPHIFLIVGVAFMSAAALFAYMGKVWVRLRGWVYRDKEPRRFWVEVAGCFLLGLFFVGYFFRLLYR